MGWEGLHDMVGNLGCAVYFGDCAPSEVLISARLKAFRTNEIAGSSVMRSIATPSPGMWAEREQRVGGR